MKHNISEKQLTDVLETYTKFHKTIPSNNQVFYAKPGKVPYALLSYLVSTYSNVDIVVADAWAGHSSLALMYEPTNRVHSFTQHEYMSSEIRNMPNHSVHAATDLLTPANLQKYSELLLRSAIIFVDHSPHRGTDEYLLYEFLKRNDYRGIVVCDHIWIHKTMRDEFWYRIPDKYRYDMTEFASESGTGIYTFNADITFDKPDVSNWTLVTAYFNLTVCPDASREICARDQKYYMSHAWSTLCLPYNLVIYCDEESRPIIESIRPAEYADRTVYKIRRFDDLQFSTCNDVDCDDRTFAEYRDKIKQNRVEKPYNFDNRNTGSYYLFCLSRYLMLIETIDENPFQSTHFCWINFCIERMGYKNLVHLPECLTTNRDRFSTCYIDYLSEPFVRDTHSFFRRGLCSMCSGFFTGHAYYMRLVCKLIIEKFLHYLELGYGHADEQLYSPVYFDRPELFDQYYGDYTEMITNYKYVYDRPTEPVHNFIRNSCNNGNYVKCVEACEFLMRSIALGKCKLDDNYMGMLAKYYLTAKIGIIRSS